MTEQFALGQSFGKGPAIDRDKGLVGAVAARVDIARDQFLARARLAHDQHIGIAGRNLGDQRQDRTRAWITEDQSAGAWANRVMLFGVEGEQGAAIGAGCGNQPYFTLIA